MTANTYRFPVQVVFGEGCLGESEALVSNFGKHALLVTGSGPTSRCAAVDTLKGVLSGAGINISHFTGVEADPGVETVEEGVEFARENDCDFVIGLGGGSPMDAAKVIAARLNNEGEVASWEGLGHIPRRARPLICIPTTSGTGSEVTWAAVITGGRRRQKMSIVSQNLYPVLALIDPELTFTMPPELTAATGMDALTHAVESFVARRAWEPTQALSLKAAQLVFSYLERACIDGSDAEARKGMSMASFLAGMAFTAAGLGIAHALAHSIGSHSGLSHGKANALLLPRVMRFNIEACPELYRELAASIGLDVAGLPAPRGADEAVKAVENLVHSLPIPANLQEAGVAVTSAETLAADAFLNTRLRSSNPRDTVLEDLVSIVREAIG